jgi:LCP family protein required for cell wall assembly
MLSATNNFFLTFLIALVIFSMIAYMLVGLVLNNLLGISEETTVPSEDTASGPEDNDPGSIGIQFGNTGESFNILLIGTDYRPSEFVDYDPQMLERLYGIVENEVLPAQPPSDIAPKPGSVVSDKSFQSPDGVLAENGSLIFSGGFYNIDYRMIETDALVLLRADKERQQFTITVFPTDAYVDMNGRYFKLSEIYGRYGLEVLLDKIYAMTGMTIEHHAVISMTDFPQLVDTLGGITYNVPFDMKYTDYAGGIDIDLKKGAQRLNGEDVLDLLMFNNYTDGGSRSKTTVEVMKKFITTFVSITNYNRAPDVFAKLETLCDTDFTLNDFKNNLDLIFKYAHNNREVSVVIKQITVGNIELTVIDEVKTCDLFASYKRIYN